MFPAMRRKDRQISRDEALEILSGAEYGILSTAMTDGQPYAVPFNFAARVHQRQDTTPGNAPKPGFSG